MRLNVPYFKQDKPYSCGPAALQMIFHHLGLVKSEKEITEDLHLAKEHGVTHEDMRRLAQDYGYFCYVNENAAFEEIIEFLSMSLPVIVNFIEPSNNDGHYAVVVGFENDELILNDPWNGEGFLIARKDFEENWHSAYERSKRWLMVVSSEKVPIGKTFSPSATR